MRMVQMTWQRSFLKRKSPLGLKNLGNSCYLNSVLQCLTYTPPLANFCLRFLHSSNCDVGASKDKKSECAFCILEKRIVRSLSTEAALDTPIKINSCLRIFAEHFKVGRQEDAHEFLRYVIDACHSTCLRLKKLKLQRRKGGVENGGNSGGSGNTVVKEIFGGALQSQVKCLSCGSESNKVDDIMDISLDVLHSGSLKDALQRFFQPEVLDGNNKYKCDNCKKLVAARKQMSILQAPNVLVIQFKRFEGMFGGKIDKPIAFEEALVLSSYMCKASQDPYPEYNLFGTIVHSGFSPDSGHYYAYIKDALGHWYCCDDSYVSLSTLREVLSEKVYILFFSRTKQRPRSANTDLVANGLMPHELNGSTTTKIQKSGYLEKPAGSKQFSDCHIEANNSTKSIETNGHDTSITQKSGGLVKPLSMEQDHYDNSMTNNSISSKVDKGHSSPERKFSVSEKSSIEKLPATRNMKIVVHKRESNGKIGNAAPSFTLTGKDKKVESLTERNGVSKIKSITSIHVDKNGSSPMASSNGNIRSMEHDTLDGSLRGANDTKTTLASARTPDCQDLLNGCSNNPSNNSGLKRKKQGDLCILFAKDAKSCAEVEAFKELIGKEASLFLRSCGWSDEVSKFMHSSKKLCAKEAGSETLHDHEKKRLLICSAKPKFISKIPESLKASLIERLKSFSRDHQSSRS
ncbi:ubiquitin carboxyl-terminal hydrolase 25-like [Olea europaea var. sylvestris]|uniref:Ubiquitin carboxyl-terminal hydrolase n=1 Tax=Olea europaea subsp. europaea TaxID=158383 RepID=A0A8S0RTG1_OLEEU|nr:ubiquitin carboxyl-terminal hydrolase 25-like [Olea europaea var. sylvestris]XP_022869941.1 ubiquitin carboxyl-terminal hydrolase 25-like [Olea europaea var. sylvestris]XP_022869942.1 ubiquitin carboxyl-terminal hydrolase 25-like [Olea europaea var. sylvestris]CAA2982785.1 ubiquitin carboxyl-terminal hydrolase 25 [Olea europaea subsp. europaea]